MYAFTDLIVAIALICFLSTGWEKGFLRSILGPVSLVIACIFAYFYYLETEDLIMALLISIIGPFILNFLASSILKLWNKATKEEKPPFSFGSFLGAVFSAFWSGSILILTIIFLAIIPSNNRFYVEIRNDIIKSHTFTFVNKIAGDKIPIAIFDFQATIEAFQDPEKLEELESSQAYQDIVNNKNIKALLSDETTLEQIQNKDIGQLLKNPNMQAILKDKELLKKFLELNKEILKKNGSE